MLAVLSIPTRAHCPLTPLRLLCAEAAFRCLVLQGGTGHGRRLTPAKPGDETGGTERTSVRVRGGTEVGAERAWKERKAESVLNDIQEILKTGFAEAKCDASKMEV